MSELFQKYWKEEISTFTKKDKPEWITVRGRHIPIKEGQSKDEAVHSFLSHSKNPSKKPSGEKEKISSKDVVSAGKDYLEHVKDSPGYSDDRAAHLKSKGHSKEIIEMIDKDPIISKLSAKIATLDEKAEEPQVSWQKYQTIQEGIEDATKKINERIKEISSGTGEKKPKEDDRPFTEQPFYQPTKVTPHYSVRFSVGHGGVNDPDAWDVWDDKKNTHAEGAARQSSKKRAIEEAKKLEEDPVFGPNRDSEENKPKKMPKSLSRLGDEINDEFNSNEKYADKGFHTSTVVHIANELYGKDNVKRLMNEKKWTPKDLRDAAFSYEPQ